MSVKYNYTDEAINTVISELVSQSGPANIIGLMLKQLLAERDEYVQELVAEQQACVDMWNQRDAALARVAQLEGALRFYAKGCGGRTHAQIALSQSSGAELAEGHSARAQEYRKSISPEQEAAVRLAQKALEPHADQDAEFYALKALTDAFGEGEGE